MYHFLIIEAVWWINRELHNQCPSSLTRETVCVCVCGSPRSRGRAAGRGRHIASVEISIIVISTFLAIEISLTKNTKNTPPRAATVGSALEATHRASLRARYRTLCNHSIQTCNTITYINYMRYADGCVLVRIFIR